MDPFTRAPFRRAPRGVRGQIIPLVALAVLTLTAMTGLAVDGGRLFWSKRRMQNAADAGAIAGAHELWRRNGDLMSQVRPAAVNDTGLNGFTDANSTITVNVPPASGPHAGNDRFVEVTIQQEVPTTFANAFGAGSATVSARSVAGLISYMDLCMLSLNPSAPAAMLVRGTADIFSNCGLMSNSSDASGFQVEGTISVTADWLGVSGGFNQEGTSGTVSPSADENVPPHPDPLAYLEPPNYAGWANAYYDSATSTYVCPGGQCVFSSRLVIGGAAGTRTFQPGTYVLMDGMQVESSNILIGDGVTFYNTGSGNIYIGGQSDISLTPPVSGPYKGVLFYADRNAPYVLNDMGRGSSTLRFRGALYFPSQGVTIEGATTGSNPWGMIVANTLDWAGDASIVWQQPPPSEMPDVTKVMLVE